MLIRCERCSSHRIPGLPCPHCTVGPLVVAGVLAGCGDASAPAPASATDPPASTPAAIEPVEEAPPAESPGSALQVIATMYGSPAPSEEVYDLLGDDAVRSLDDALAGVGAHPVLRLGDVVSTLEAGDADAVRVQLERRRANFQYVLDEQLKHVPSLSGRVRLRFDIKTGRVANATLIENTTGSEDLGRGIVTALRGTRLPEEMTGSVSSVTWVIGGGS